MRKLFFLFAMILIFGCMRARPLPDMPTYRTRRGAECAKECHKMHSWCIAGCVKGHNRRARKTCFAQCSEKLKECYDLCLIEDRPPGSESP